MLSGVTVFSTRDFPLAAAAVSYSGVTVFSIPLDFRSRCRLVFRDVRRAFCCVVRLCSLTAIVIVIVNLCDSATSFGMMTIMSAQES